MFTFARKFSLSNESFKFLRLDQFQDIIYENGNDAFNQDKEHERNQGDK